MDFAHSERSMDLQARMTAFMDEHVYAAEPVYERQRAEAADPHALPPVVEELKAKARDLGLWNLFLPDEHHGGGLSNLEYAPIAEISGRSVEIAPEAINCAAPDTGNMELLHMFGTPEQQERWLHPLLEGEIRSCFGMTEPAVASSDATNMEATITDEGDHYLVNGRKWWSTGAADPRCKVAIVMGVSNADGPRYGQHSMVLVPFDAPGVTVERQLTVFGYDDQHGHPVVRYENVHVPKENLLGEAGAGFALAQARLGPGRVHHCMRTIGLCERALGLMVDRVSNRVAFGAPLADRGVIREWIALSRIQIEQARLLTLKTAWMMDTVGNKHAQKEIAAIKVVAGRMACEIIDRAIQSFGGAGVSGDFPLAAMYAGARTMRIVDGPDEVHLRAIGRQEIRERAGNPAPVSP
ncbi:MAG: acyl-CoA dehydrogenase family protein [Baekduia sp.]